MECIANTMNLGSSVQAKMHVKNGENITDMPFLVLVIHQPASQVVAPIDFVMQRECTPRVHLNSAEANVRNRAVIVQRSSLHEVHGVPSHVPLRRGAERCQRSRRHHQDAAHHSGCGLVADGLQVCLMARCPVTEPSVEETFNTSFSETGAGKHVPCGLRQS